MSSMVIGCGQHHVYNIVVEHSPCHRHEPTSRQGGGGGGGKGAALYYYGYGMRPSSLAYVVDALVGSTL